MSAIISLKNKLAATDVSLEDLKQRIDVLNREIEETSQSRERLVQKIARLEEIAAEEADILASERREEVVAAAPTPVNQEAEVVVRTRLPVFSTVARHDIEAGRITVSDFKEFVACSYQLSEDLSRPFSEKNEKKFKDHVKAMHRADLGGAVGGGVAKKVYDFMKTGTDNIGKKIVVAYDKGCGGGGEIREITGPYRFRPIAARTSDRPSGFYCHQFPTKLIRPLTAEESKEIVEARKQQGPRDLNWNTEIAI